MNLRQIAERTSPDSEACTYGLSPNKVGPEEELAVLEALGYIKRVQREKWNAVLIPCDRGDILVKEVAAFESFLTDNEPKEAAPIPQPSITSTVPIDL